AMINEGSKNSQSEVNEMYAELEEARKVLEGVGGSLSELKRDYEYYERTYKNGDGEKYITGTWDKFLNAMEDTLAFIEKAEEDGVQQEDIEKQRALLEKAVEQLSQRGDIPGLRELYETYKNNRYVDEAGRVEKYTLKTWTKFAEV